ncbi:MAG: StbB family protein [Aeromonas sp.]
MYLKLAVVNNSGNVGKSTLCATLLKPRLENSAIVRVETLNSDGTNAEKFSAKEFDSILHKMDETECAILDVGSSNIESFIIQMGEYQGSQQLIDYFIIPVVKEAKQQQDSVMTVMHLLALGIEKSRIKIIFNFAEKNDAIEKQYQIFFASEICREIATAGAFPVVYQNNIFAILHKNGLRYDEVYNDDRDFRSLLRAAETAEDRQVLSNRRTVKMLMNGFNSDLDVAFANLDF